MWNTNKRTYYFTINDWDYQVIISDNNSDIEYPWIGFKAKPSKEESDFYFDMDVLTNNGIFQVISKIKDIIKVDSKKYKCKGYSFSTFNNKKGNQRMNVYLRALAHSGIKYQITDDYNKAKLTMESKILTYTQFLKESTSNKKQYDVIESRYVYSTYCPIWFTGTEDACYRFIISAQKSDPSVMFELREKKSIEK